MHEAARPAILELLLNLSEKAIQPGFEPTTVARVSLVSSHAIYKPFPSRSIAYCGMSTIVWNNIPHYYGAWRTGNKKYQFKNITLIENTISQ